MSFLNKDNIFNKKARISYFEIFVLMVAIFSFSYIIYSSEGVKAQTQNKSVNSTATSNQTTQNVSAAKKTIELQTTSISLGQVSICCEETSLGGKCQNVLSQTACNSKLQIAPITCEKTDFCALGCCIDKENGVYDKRVPKSLCNGEWNSDMNCNLPEAERGCCVLGNNGIYVTEQKCAKISESAGTGKNWKKETPEIDCVSIANEQDKGACLFTNQNCKVTAKSECPSSMGKFFVGKLCTAQSVGSICTKTEKTTCIEGRDEVYFIDSCGNTANIYDALKFNQESYWENIIDKKDSCGGLTGSAAGSSDCGNCNRFSSSKCAAATTSTGVPKYGDYICKSLGCDYTYTMKVKKNASETNLSSELQKAKQLVDNSDLVNNPWLSGLNEEREKLFSNNTLMEELYNSQYKTITKTKSYQNGETWCVYEGSIQNGVAPVGSRHYRYVCNNGEIQVEPCADYRQEICVQKDVVIDASTNSTYSSAVCSVNNWRACFDKTADKCFPEDGCFLNKFSINNFAPSICAPIIPSGFSFDEKGSGDAEKVCSLGTKTCKVQYQKDVDLKWKCIKNCECETREFVTKMNNFCTALGDCGGWVNYEGEFSDEGYTVSGDTPRKLPADYKISAQQFAEMDFEQYNKDYSAHSGLIFGNLDKVNNVLGAINGVFMAIAALFSWNPVGWVAMLIIAGVDITIKLSGIGKEKSYYVTYTCQPWEAPSGGANCGACNNLPNDMPCTEYKCKSLGAGCELLNKGTENELCAWKNTGDVLPPLISPLNKNLTVGVTYRDIQARGFSVTDLTGNCVEPYTTIPINIQTSEPAICKYDTELTEYDNMQFSFGGSYSTEHYSKYLATGETQGVSASPGTNQQINFYVRCVDSNGVGKESPLLYSVSTCIKSGGDFVPPKIDYLSPENEVIMSKETKQQAVSAFTNEPSTCKWAKQDKDYDLMENNFICNQEDRSVFGYECDTNMTLDSEKNDFYIRCKDQPWLETGTNVSGTNKTQQRNVNLQSYHYVLKKSQNGLKIDSIVPSGYIESETDAATVIMKVTTSGGVANPLCKYSFDNYDVGAIQFKFTQSSSHEQEFNLVVGNYSVYVSCQDSAGNTAKQKTDFMIGKDATPLEVSGIYREGEQINLMTTKNADCRYSLDSCSFDFDIAKSLGTTKEHLIPVTGHTYYIKCKDLAGNLPDAGKCTTSVKATR